MRHCKTERSTRTAVARMTCTSRVERLYEEEQQALRELHCGGGGHIGRAPEAFDAQYRQTQQTRAPRAAVRASRERPARSSAWPGGMIEDRAAQRHLEPGRARRIDHRRAAAHRALRNRGRTEASQLLAVNGDANGVHAAGNADEETDGNTAGAADGGRGQGHPARPNAVLMIVGIRRERPVNGVPFVACYPRRVRAGRSRRQGPGAVQFRYGALCVLRIYAPISQP